jgi:hypothetical protein
VAHVGSDERLVVARRPLVDDAVLFAACLERDAFKTEPYERHVLLSLLGRLTLDQLAELLVNRVEDVRRRALLVRLVLRPLEPERAAQEVEA